MFLCLSAFYNTEDGRPVGGVFVFLSVKTQTWRGRGGDSCQYPIFRVGDEAGMGSEWRLSLRELG